MKNKKKKINKVCSECGISANVLTCVKKYGNRPDKLCFTFSTYHIGQCDVCHRTEDEDGEPISVTEPRDFFYPMFSLLPLFEEWRPVVGWEGLYEVSSLGNVKSLAKKINTNNQFGACSKEMTEKMLKPGRCKKGYRLVVLCKNGKMQTRKIARLVAKAFLPNPSNKPQVNHIDGDKTNDVASNLEWCTNGENQKHAWGTGLNKGARGTHWTKKKRL